MRAAFAPPPEPAAPGAMAARRSRTTKADNGTQSSTQPRFTVPTNEHIARAYADAVCKGDLEAMARLRHRDWQSVWPQSGERVISSENYRRIVEAYPGGRPRVETQRVVGAEDRYVVTAGNTVQQIVGSGDFWWSDWRMIYPDGRTYWCVTLMELRDEQIWRETVYWAEPFTAPDWRSRWVEGPSPEAQAAD